MTRDRAERVAGLFLLAFSLAYFLLAFGIRLPPFAGDGPLSARSMPFALGLAGMALSLAVVLRPPPGDEIPWRAFSWGRAAALLGLMGLYAAAIPHLGFVITSSLFLAGGFLVLGERRPLLLLAVAVGTALAFFAAFGMLDVHLDWGVFGRLGS